MLINLASLVAWNFLVGVLYCFFGYLGLSLATFGEAVTLFWAPSGIAFAFLFAKGFRLAPGVWLGAVLTNLLFGASAFVACSIAAGNLLEGMTLVVLMKRFVGVRVNLQTHKDVFWFLVFGGLIAPAIAATLGSTTLFLDGSLPATAWLAAWIHWIAGDGVGILFVAPVLILLLEGPRRLFTEPNQGVEFGLAVVALCAAAFYVLWGPPMGSEGSRSIAVVVPFVIWVAMRFTFLASASLALIVSIIAVTGLAQGLGPQIRDTSQLSALTSWSFLLVMNGSVLWLSVVLNDKRRALERARFDQLRYLELAEQTNALILRTTAEGRLTDINGFARSLLRLGDEQIGENAITAIFGEKSTEFRDVIEEGHELPLAGFSFIGYHPRPNKPICRVLWTITPVLSEAGELEEFRLLGVDDTSRYQAEKALSEVEHRHREMMDLLPLIVFEADLGGTLTYFNAHGLASLGHGEDELIGESASLVLATDQIEAVTGWVRNALHAEIEPLEFDLVSKNGQRITVLCYARRIFEQSKVVGLHGVAIDISERKELENALVSAKEDAEEMLEAKTRFLSTMSHELRTPLNAILGFSEIMRSPQSEPMTEKQQRYVQMIFDCGHHLLALINNILDLSRIESGKLPLHPEHVTVHQLVEVPLAVMQTQLGDKQIGVELDVDPTLESADVDSIRYAQIMFNLLSNAIKFSPSGSCIHVGIRRLGDESFEVSIRDEGPGIPEQEQQMIFDEFYQADHARDAQLGGAGIGLAITRKLIELHRGSISIVSRPGEGATFSFRLPLRQPNEDIAPIQMES